MHTRQPEEFAYLLDEAADYIAAQKFHPGQTFPGVWSLDDAGNEPARLIGVIVTLALVHVCRDRNINAQEALSSYAAVSRTVTLTARGSPDIMAAQHLRDAAKALRRVDA